MYILLDCLHELTEKVYITEEEAKSMNSDDVFYELDEINEKEKLYKETEVELTNDEMNQYILLKLLEDNSENKENIRIIKNCVVIWFILTIISIIITIFYAVLNS